MRGHLIACALCLVLVACMDRPEKYKYHPPQYVPAQQYQPQPNYRRDNDDEYMLLMDPSNNNGQYY